MIKSGSGVLELLLILCLMLSGVAFFNTLNIVINMKYIDEKSESNLKISKRTPDDQEIITRYAFPSEFENSGTLYPASFQMQIKDDWKSSGVYDMHCVQEMPYGARLAVYLVADQMEPSNVLTDIGVDKEEFKSKGMILANYCRTNGTIDDPDVSYGYVKDSGESYIDASNGMLYATENHDRKTVDVQTGFPNKSGYFSNTSKDPSKETSHQHNDYRRLNLSSYLNKVFASYGAGGTKNYIQRGRCDCDLDETTDYKQHNYLIWNYDMDEWQWTHHRYITAIQ